MEKKKFTGVETGSGQRPKMVRDTYMADPAVLKRLRELSQGRAKGWKSKVIREAIDSVLRQEP